MSNIILFGGAFDPVHFGHINMAERASEFLDADVIFIPAAISVWKKESAIPEHKINMLELAIKESPLKARFSVSGYEARKKDKDYTYTVDTIRYFKKKYPKDKLYLLIGQDQVNKFHLWKEPDEIVKMSQIVFFGRLNEEKESENIKKYKMIPISGEINDISSTNIRELRVLETYDSVLKYIIDNDLYFMRQIKESMTQQRYEHSKRVGWLSYEIAKANNYKDPHKVLIAGLLHDLGKIRPEYEKESFKIIEEKHPEYLDLPKPIWHQVIGVDKAKSIFGIEDKEILEAIEYHTTGNANIGDIAKIVYAADKIEPGRNFDSTDLINAMKCSITDGFVTVLKANIEYFEEKHLEYKNKFTLACIDYYLK